jgi:FkbM family methyltransferase
MPTLLQRLDKPEYLFRPRQLLRRLAAPWRSWPAEVVCSLPWGLSLEVEPRETIGRAVLHLGVYDVLVSEVLWRLTAPGEQALDVGANIGHMSSVLAMRVGPSGQVLAFEPHPLLQERLRRNVARWRESPGCGRVETRAVALGDSEREGHLRVPAGFQENAGLASLVEGPEASHGERVVSVPVQVLDQAVPPPLAPAVMKLDVEGGEAAVLRGAPRLLATCLRDIVFEDHGSWPTPAMELLTQAGYTLFRLRKSLLGPRLVPASEPPPAGAWEAPSYLATREPERARSLLAPRGWRVLG